MQIQANLYSSLTNPPQLSYSKDSRSKNCIIFIGYCAIQKKSNQTIMWPDELFWQKSTFSLLCFVLLQNCGHASHYAKRSWLQKFSLSYSGIKKVRKKGGKK